MMPAMPFMAGDVHADTGDVSINATNFPDTNFRNWVIGNITGAGDNVLTTSELDDVKSIEVYNKSISSLKGIEYFTSLTSLNCGDNDLTTLNVRENMLLKTFNFDNNELTNIDVSQNTELATLDCSGNNLSSLDVSQNTSLLNLECRNNDLTTLDMSQNTLLTSLICNNNTLRTLDVSHSPSLQILI